MQSNSFETLLLRMATPQNASPAKKKRRIENAEIITKSSYLQQLQDKEIKNRQDSEIKAEGKLKLLEKRAESKKLKDNSKSEKYSKSTKEKKPEKAKPVKVSTRTSTRKKTGERRCTF